MHTDTHTFLIQPEPWTELSTINPLPTLICLLEHPSVSPQPQDKGPAPNGNLQASPWIGPHPSLLKPPLCWKFPREVSLLLLL